MEFRHYIIVVCTALFGLMTLCGILHQMGYESGFKDAYRAQLRGRLECVIEERYPGWTP